MLRDGWRKTKHVRVASLFSTGKKYLLVFLISRLHDRDMLYIPKARELPRIILPLQECYLKGMSVYWNRLCICDSIVRLPKKTQYREKNFQLLALVFPSSAKKRRKCFFIYFLKHLRIFDLHNNATVHLNLFLNS